MVTWFKALCAGGGNVTFDRLYRFGGLIDPCSALGDCLQRVTLVVLVTHAG